MFLTFGEEYEKNTRREFASDAEALALEDSFWGLTHCEAGEYAARDWHFPDLLRTCMSQHHEPPAANPGDPINLVRLSCRLAAAAGFPEVQCPEVHSEALASPELPERLRDCPELQAEGLRDYVLPRIEAFERGGRGVSKQ